MEMGKNRLTRMNETIEAAASRGEAGMFLNLFEKDWNKLSKMGFELKEIARNKEGGTKTFVSWSIKRSLTIRESEYISGWSNDIIDFHGDMAERRALETMRAIALRQNASKD